MRSRIRDVWLATPGVLNPERRPILDANALCSSLVSHMSTRGKCWLLIGWNVRVFGHEDVRGLWSEVSLFCLVWSSDVHHLERFI